MARKKKEFIYCIYCGRKCDIKSDVCDNCHKNLKKHDSYLKLYLKENIPTKFKDDLISNFFDLATTYVKSHLWGVFSFATVIFCATAVVLNVTNKNNDYDADVIVDNRPKLLAKEVLVCKEGYTLIDNKCHKDKGKEEILEPEVITVIPTTTKKVERETTTTKKGETTTKNDKCRSGVDVKLSCESGYTLEDNKCIKRTYTTPNGSEFCPPDFYTSPVSDKCVKSAVFTEVGPHCAHFEEHYIAKGIDMNNYHTESSYMDAATKICHNVVCTDPPTCSNLVNVDFDAYYKFSCETGAVRLPEQGGACYFVKDFENNYSCDKGVLTSDHKCLIETTKAATKSCNSGYKLDTSCNKCIKN